jgi:pimeloyl-ACP methyl ester carboxylesterase
MNAAERWPLPPALGGTRLRLDDGAGAPLAAYASPRAERPRPDEPSPPLLMLHGAGPGSSAAELKPLYQTFAATRPVLVLELPGFASSAGAGAQPTPRRMRSAILCAVAWLRRGAPRPVDVIAVALSCEFTTLAALERPSWFRALAFVSPSGLEATRIEAYEDGATGERPMLHAFLHGPWSSGLLALLTRRSVLRRWLRRRWGVARIDDALLDYSALAARAPGGQPAAWASIAGALFTRGIARLYAALPHPVWVAHGVRGAFSDVGALWRIGPPSNWRVTRFETGAMPHLEAAQHFLREYQAFIGDLERSRMPQAPYLHPAGELP